LLKKYNDIPGQERQEQKSFTKQKKSLKHCIIAVKSWIINQLGIQNDNFKQQKQAEFRIYNSLAMSLERLEPCSLFWYFDTSMLF
jgi:hypothetical protein